MKRRKWLLPGCAVTLLLLLVVLVITGAPAALALRLAGLRSEGNTVDYFQKKAIAVLPTIQWFNSAAQPVESTATPAASVAAGESAVEEQSPAGPQPLEEVVVDVWFLSQPETFDASQVFAERLERGSLDDDQVAYYIEYDEVGLNTYLNTWVGAYAASQLPMRNPWIDLKPGGAVVYAEVDLEVGWQEVGAVFVLDESGRQFLLSGLDVGGRYYSLPPEGEVADLAHQLETEGNRALQDLTFIDPAGSLTVQSINLTEDNVRILAY